MTHRRTTRASLLLGADEAGSDILPTLAPLAPDPLRADRVRARCRAALEQRRGRTRRAQRVVGVCRGVLAPAIVGVFCLLYVVALVATTLRVRVGGP